MTSTRIKDILIRMLYLFRLRRLIKITLEEYESVSIEDKKKRAEYFRYPKYGDVYARFKVLNKKRKLKVFSYILAIGEADNYIRVHPYPSSTSASLHIPPTISVTKKGIKIITPSIFFNLITNSISPALSLFLSASAIIVSILVAIYK